VALALGVPVTAYMAHKLVRPEAIAKFRSRGGKMVVAGETLYEAARLARRRAEREQAVYVDPFADPAFVNGCATLGLELFETTPAPGLLVLPAGPSSGLGLLGALAMVAKTLSRGVRVVGVEFEELPLLERALADRTPPPAAAESLALGPLRPECFNLDLVRRYVDELVQVSHAEVQAALETLWFELAAGVSPDGAAGLAAVLCGRLSPASGEPTSVLISEAGFQGLFWSAQAPIDNPS
jgi:threonine dehydratase